ncbi:oxidoreductase domain-containing protein [Podospora appendiculata]|uniref:Oxidoreductase domain-containing protein n=1 Tax=Podospora appendiculata TaxID=314037 RepID=A0AAE1CAV0_9PEZI|nr:oxidoreductase domain-containing protein [Podospora appendiculata]
MLSSLFKRSAPKSSSSSAPSQPTVTPPLKHNQPIQTTYKSNPIPLPPSFLTTDPPDLHQPTTYTQIDFSRTAVPEYAGLYAAVLDNVLSPSECQTLLSLAEASVPLPNAAAGGASESAWAPAMVNVGMGFEVLTPSYRNSDRIIWDQQEVVDRIWARCLRAPGLGKRLAVVEGEPAITGPENWGRRGGRGTRWEFRRVNQRMRFLRYGKGQYFRPHCDGPYSETDADKTVETLFTVHLYLNDSQAEAGHEAAAAADLVGGATPFLSDDETRKVDVHPKAGRVLIFQHRRLLHSGADVVQGTKYTMRTDIVYEMIREKDDK